MRCAGAKHNHLRAFSLLEVVGVLAVVAILAGCLIATVFNAIHRASLNQTAASVNAVRCACAGHYAHFGCFAEDGSLNPPAAIALDGSDSRSSQFDKVLLSETLLDGLFAPKIGDGILSTTNTRVQIVAGLPADTTPDQNNAAYNLDGKGINEASGGIVVEAVITGVSLEDARGLNDILDGPSLSEDLSGNDLVGRVKYSVQATSSGSGNSGSGTGSGSAGSGSGNGNNGNGLGNGNGNGGNNNGNGNGGNDHGNGNGNGNGGGNGNGNGSGNGNGNGSGSSGSSGSGSGGSGSSNSTANTVTVHIYLTHR